MAEDFANISYNDLDLIFSVDLTTGKAYERVKAAVLDSLLELLPEGVSRKRMSSCSLKEAYVSKVSLLTTIIKLYNKVTFWPTCQGHVYDTVGLIQKSPTVKFPFIVLRNFRSGSCFWTIFVKQDRVFS